MTSGHLSERHHAILGGDDVTGCSICISQGFSEKQNQRGVCVSMERERLSSLADAVVETGKLD